VALSGSNVVGKSLAEVVAWKLWYNRTQLHSTLTYVSAVRFEENCRADQPRQSSARQRLWDTKSRGKLIRSLNDQLRYV
jgi:putative transposase